MQRRNGTAPGVLGEPLPAELLRRSRVVQVLHAYRGQHAGTSLTTLCALARRTPAETEAQVEAAERYLIRVGSVWAIWAEDRETEDGTQERYFWLVAPHCPRPAARHLPEWHEPEFVSWSEVDELYPVLPRWEI